MSQQNSTNFLSFLNLCLICENLLTEKPMLKIIALYTQLCRKYSLSFCYVILQFTSAFERKLLLFVN